MIYPVAGFGLLLHIFFWGLGVALLLSPRPWIRYALLFAPAAGVALQSAVVWFGASVGLHGTDFYAYGSEVIALLALGGGLWRCRRNWRSVVAGTKRSAAVWGVVAAVLIALLFPMATASKALTTMSLGSCDAADYAAGARVFQEFSRNDLSGFNGQIETVKVGRADTFFEFWMRLNHFTPSAVVALNNSIFGWEGYQTISVLTAVFVALSLPMVFWLSRAGLRLGPVASTMVAWFYGASPVLWYATYHVATAQLLASMAVAMLTWCGLALWRSGANWRRGWAFAGLLVVAYWLLLGAYNFILIVVFVPLGAYVGGRAIWEKSWGKLWRWSVLMTVPLCVAGLVFAGRVVGLVERLVLLKATNFGWKIAALAPEGWFGIVADDSLRPYAGVTRAWLMAGAVAVIAAGLVWCFLRRKERGFLALCLTMPIFVGYSYLLWRGAKMGTFASYDAYKLFSVFYPGILGAICCWLTWGRGEWRRSWTAKAWVIVFAGCVLALQAKVAWGFSKRMQSPPLMVDRWLVQLKNLETIERFDSFNMLATDDWSRLWANVFLLKKNQYFATNTYEGRLRTELKGNWDLLCGVVSIRLPEDGDDVPDYIDLSRNSPGSGPRRTPAPSGPGPQFGPLPFSLVNTRSEYFIRAQVADGWYPAEQIPRAGTRWRWTKGDASIRVENPHDYPVKIAFRFNARSVEPRDLQIWVNDKRLRSAQLGKDLKIIRIGGIEVPPGTTLIQLRSASAPNFFPGDGRPMGFAAYGIELVVLPRQEMLEP
ncbi:MAG: hypothetical protein QM760_13495 [Nibricoccus sp.]